jgi:hypothetical protein
VNRRRRSVAGGVRPPNPTIQSTPAPESKKRWSGGEKRSAILFDTRARRATLPRNRFVRCRVLVMEIKEFRTEIRGCETNLDRWFRSPVRVSRNGECGGGIAVNPWRELPVTRKARPPISRRRALTGGPVGFATGGIAPRNQPSSKRVAPQEPSYCDSSAARSKLSLRSFSRSWSSVRPGSQP